MPRVRSPEREKAKEIYDQHNGNITNREIANILNISEKSVSGWKVKDKWNGELNGVLQKKIRSTPNKKTTTKEPVSRAVKETTEGEELTDKQKDFCLYYVKCRNKTKAYMKAYKCSWINANAHAYEVWENVGVRKEINKLLEEVRNNVMYDISDLIQLNMDIAFADMKDFTEWGKKEVETDVMNPDGTPVKLNINYVDFKESEEIDGTLVSEVKKGKDGVSIKLQDKGKAIDFLYKHLMYVNEEDKRKLEIANKQYQIDKTKAEITKINGPKNEEIVDDGFIKALEGKIGEVWEDETEGNRV